MFDKDMMRPDRFPGLNCKYFIFTHPVYMAQGISHNTKCSYSSLYLRIHLIAQIQSCVFKDDRETFT